MSLIPLKTFTSILIHIKEWGMNMTYKGPERRQLLNLRRMIHESFKLQRDAMISMARRLGPGGLQEIDAQIKENNVSGWNKYSEKGRISFRWQMRGLSPRIAASASHLIDKPCSEIPEQIQGIELASFMLSKGTRFSLEKSGLVTVKDFVMKPAEELVEMHSLESDAVKEIRDVLFSYGIRSINNPPPESKQ